MASRARSPRSSAASCGRCPGVDPAQRRRREGRDRDRRPGRLPALRRAALPRRHDRRVAALAQGAPPRRRHAPDLERRRRHELRDARARQPAARLRLRHARRRADRRAARARRARSCARSTATTASSTRDDLLIADAERAVALAGIMGGEETEVGEDDDDRPARGGELRAGRDPPQLRAARAAHRGLEPLGEGRRPVPRRAGRRASRRSSSSSSRARAWTGGDATCRASCPSRP